MVSVRLTVGGTEKPQAAPRGLRWPIGAARVHWTSHRTGPERTGAWRKLIKKRFDLENLENA